MRLPLALLALTLMGSAAFAAVPEAEPYIREHLPEIAHEVFPDNGNLNWDILAYGEWKGGDQIADLVAESAPTDVGFNPVRFFIDTKLEKPKAIAVYNHAASGGWHLVGHDEAAQVPDRLE